MSNFIANNHAYINLGGTGTGAGIFVVGSRNRIEGNDVRDYNIGIDVDGTNNLIIRNSAEGYDIVAGNAVGPIVDSTNFAADSNPHTNYEY